MNFRSKKWAITLGVSFMFLFVDGHFDGFLLSSFSPISDADARVGRPRTPRSVAGVARRTTRRVVRRSAIYVSTLPGGCGRTTVNGVSVWLCGGTYYQASGGRYVVVYVD